MENFTNHILNSFTNVSQIVVETSKDDLVSLLRQFEENSIKDIEEYQMSYYYNQGISDYEIEFKDVLMYVESENGFIPAKFGYFYLKTNEIEAIT